MMLMYAYVASLIVGGVLLGASIFLGGQDADADFDADGDLDFDADGDFDVDGEFDVEKGLDISADGAELFWFLKSLRFWTFFLAFFGLTGVVLRGLGLMESDMGTLIAAIVVGAFSGGTAAAVIRTLSKDTTGEAGGQRDIVGKTARVLVPASPGGTAKVRVEIKGQHVDLLATGHDRELKASDEVLVVEMEGTRVRVAHLDD